MENVKKEDISSLAKNAVKKLSSSRRKITASEVCHTSVLSFTFRFLSSPPLLLFWSRFFFSWAFTTPFIGEKSSGESYCVWGSYDYMERKVGDGWWSKIVMSISGWTLHDFFFFSGLLECIVLIGGMVWKISSRCPRKMTKLSLTIKADYFTSARREVMGSLWANGQRQKISLGKCNGCPVFCKVIHRKSSL